MMNVILESAINERPLWIDLQHPTKEEMEKIANQYALHEEMILDCLDPLHLPKYESHFDTTLIIVRLYDENSSIEEDSMQKMTKKLAIFIGDRYLLSIHKNELKFIEVLARKYQKKNMSEIYLQELMLELLSEAVSSYQKPLAEMEELCQDFETSILHNQEKLKWEEIFRTKSRLMTIKRMLWHAQQTIVKFVPHHESHRPQYQDLMEEITGLVFLTETLIEDLGSLLNIQMSLATQKTNEVMRLLTLFSVFFMPLTFIVGIYGMNFEHMPELKHPLGYLGVWAVMIFTTTLIYLGFKKKKWL